MSGIAKSAGIKAEETIAERISGIAEKYRGMEGCLIQVLHEVQGVYGYLSPEVQKYIAKELGLSLSTVSGVISFYSFFSTEPKAKHTVKICLGTACYVRGGEKIVEAIEKTLGVKAGENTPDNSFSFQITRCLGACGLAPVVVVDEKVHGQMTPESTTALLQRIKKEDEIDV